MERDAFLDRITQALGGSHSQLQAPDPAAAETVLQSVRDRGDARRERLMAALSTAARELNITLRQFEGLDAAGRAVAQLAQERQPEWADRREVVAWDDPLVARLDLEKHLSAAGIGLTVTVGPTGTGTTDPDGRARHRRTVRDAAHALVGVTTVDFCLADTATLVMRTRPGQARSVSLLPSIHVAVLPVDRILSDFKELCYLLSFDEKERREGLTNCMTLISGPSKTADIEVVMVEGVHGPREVHIYVVTHRD